MRAAKPEGAPDGLDIEFLSKVVKYSRRRSENFVKPMKNKRFFVEESHRNSDFSAEELQGGTGVGKARIHA
jgi:hypothetical protein